MNYLSPCDVYTTTRHVVLGGFSTVLFGIFGSSVRYVGINYFCSGTDIFPTVIRSQVRMSLKAARGCAFRFNEITK